MAYDPFASSQSSGFLSKEAKLLNPRRPPIFDVPLAPLEWRESSAHKRARPYPSPRSNNVPSSSPPSRRTEDVLRSRSAPQEKVREVVRIVEKVVEPITIMGVPPLVDDRVRYVVNFILHHVTSPNVEVEAKVGTLIEKSQECRAVNVMPVLCETPIRPESNQDTKFFSDVGEDVFKRLNAVLNDRVDATAGQEVGCVQYLRTREKDVYWPGRIRESMEKREDQDGREVYETVRIQSKKRLGDLNVLCPGSNLDIRYSASSEDDCQLPRNSAPEMQRIKDRISYKFDYLSVDITSVVMEHAITQEVVNSFEVEVEIDAASDLYGEVCKYRHGDETSKIFDIAGSLVNTVRLILDV